MAGHLLELYWEMNRIRKWRGSTRFILRVLFFTSFWKFVPNFWLPAVPRYYPIVGFVNYLACIGIPLITIWTGIQYILRRASLSLRALYRGILGLLNFWVQNPALYFQADVDNALCDWVSIRSRIRAAGCPDARVIWSLIYRFRLLIILIIYPLKRLIANDVRARV